ncbi:unnamed protein product [Protopolystoma xenopodis]|uniref:Uncharacterized protein n=1 Tax=Protopolystoma xenopodis TaxID=117903 RepID=A0A448XLK0_9PLAT|nr:unnamed protein product [Protopolystoma xenopodis]
MALAYLASSSIKANLRVLETPRSFREWPTWAGVMSVKWVLNALTIGLKCSIVKCNFRNLWLADSSIWQASIITLVLFGDGQGEEYDEREEVGDGESDACEDDDETLGSSFAYSE